MRSHGLLAAVGLACVLALAGSPVPTAQSTRGARPAPQRQARHWLKTLTLRDKVAQLVMIPFYGRLLSLVDVYDALHRVNGKHGAERMDGEAMKRKMLEWNPDQRKLIMEAYEANIFTTRLFEEETEPASV